MVTNEGPLHDRLEHALADKLGVPMAKVFSSGTSALQCALLSLELPVGAEVITTPLTFPATAHAITALGLKPVFADIDPETLTLDPSAVERAITPHTAAVIGVHVYGTICDVERLQRICDRHDLRLVFDAAHAFASEKAREKIACMGDMSVFSMHATKLFNTIEGGLVTSNNSAWGERLSLSRNFGIASEESVQSVGINGKMSELHAAVGLLNLELFEEERAIRRGLRARYDLVLQRFPGLKKQLYQPDVYQSEQYYMLRVDPDAFGSTRDDVCHRLKEREIIARRYFWPICTDYDCYRNYPITSLQAVPVAEQVKTTLLCLPFHSGVTNAHIETIASVFEDLHAGVTIAV